VNSAQFGAKPLPKKQGRFAIAEVYINPPASE